MAKLGAESLQYLSPIASDCTKPEISSVGENSKLQNDLALHILTQLEHQQRGSLHRMHATLCSAEICPEETYTQPARKNKKHQMRPLTGQAQQPPWHQAQLYIYIVKKVN